MSAERWASRPESLRQVSEWAGRELVVALSRSAQAADALLLQSLDLVHRLPGTLAALEAGALHPGHLWTMLNHVAPVEDPVVRAEVEAELLRWAAGRVVAPAQLSDKARREVARRDARAAARRLQKALKERGVHLRPHDVGGMATLTVVATMPEAQALYRALIACADSLDEDDDPRTRAEKMLDCLLDLVLRPGESDLPPVQVLLTVVASVVTLAGGDQPGEIDGQVVPAELVRRLLAALTGTELGCVDDPDETTPERPAGSPGWEDREQRELERWWAETERRVLAGELVDPDPEPCPLPAQGPDHRPLARDLWLDDRSTEPPGYYPAPPVEAPPAEDPPSEGPPAEYPPTASQTDEAQPAAGTTEQSAGETWWMDADRAVDDAGRATDQARRALAAAERMVRIAAAADAADEDAWHAGGGGRHTAAQDALTSLRSATAGQRELLVDLLSATGGGGLIERPRVALTDALTGALLALTDLPRMRRAGSCGAIACRRPGGECEHDLTGRPGLGPPGPTDGYRPSAELDRWTRARDRRCRFPGCRRPVPRGGELDHALPHPLGPTSAANLVGYCTSDHRGKHQAPGWAHRLDPDGTLTVTTPTGLVAVTTPPPYSYGGPPF